MSSIRRFFNWFFSAQPGQIRPLLSPSIVIPYLIGAAIALWWPESWSHGVLEPVFEFFKSMVPSIAGYAKRSHFGDVSVAYFSFSSVLFLPWLVLLLKYDWFIFGSPEKLDKQWLRVRNMRFPTLWCIFVVLFCLLPILAGWIQPGYQFNMIPVNNHRWALAVYGPLCSFFFALYIFMGGCVLAYLKFLVKLTSKGE